MSCKCQRCGNQYKVDLIIDDELWNTYIKPKEKPEGSGMLCGSCIMQRIENLYEYNAFKLEKIK